ncbi:MAG TPA: hypothetical protein DCS63_08210 [Elusimicrobia bacterium]|nr:hypothetical protein [Elusimicrobiota bacterium]
MKNIILIAFLAAAGGYWLLLSRPALYYPDSREYKCFTLRGRGELPSGTQLALDRALASISASEFFSPDTKFDIYLAGGPRGLSFFAPFVAGNYSRVSPISGGIFLAAARFDGDSILPSPEAAETRDLNKVIAAAAARKMAMDRVKPLTYIYMTDWEFAGYGEIISGGSGLFKPEDICGKEAPEGSALLEYKYGLAVALVLSEEKMSFANLLDKNFSYEGAERQLKQRYCGR